MDICHGMVDFDTDTWMVIEKENRWDLTRPAVTISYFEKFDSFNAFYKFLKEQEKCLIPK